MTALGHGICPCRIVRVGVLQRIYYLKHQEICRFLYSQGVSRHCPISSCILLMLTRDAILYVKEHYKLLYFLRKAVQRCSGY